MSSVATLVPPAVFDQMVALRRALHQHPELSWQEHATARRITGAAAQLGLVTRPLTETGLVAEIPGRDTDAPIVALRADTDALPIHEETGLPFSSVNDGVMHACGHDGHSSILLGAAALLLADPPPVTVRLLWQPAEERGCGAHACVEAGALEGVGAIFGCHLDRHYPPGTLVVTEGAVNASTDEFRIEIMGRQGHGARPHESLDAVVVGSLLVTALQTIVSREVDPAHPSVISVGRFDAGTAANVIAGRALLEGTIRAQHHGVRQHLRRSLERIAVAIGQLHEAQITVAFSDGTPPLVNTPQMTALAREAALALVGPEQVEPLRTVNMGGEDFAEYLLHVPGAYIRIGAAIPGKEGFPAHSSRFDWDEQALAGGAAWLAGVARVAGARLAAGERFGDPRGAVE